MTEPPTAPVRSTVWDTMDAFQAAPSEDHGPIIHAVTVPVGADRAFEAFTSELALWWDPRLTADAATFRDVRLDPAVGTDVEFVHEGGLRYRFGTITVWQPPTHFAMSFCLALDPEHPTTLGADFARDGATRTRLTLTHGGWGPDNVADRARFNEWPALLESYRRHLRPAF